MSGSWAGGKHERAATASSEPPCVEASAREASYLLALLELSRLPEPPTQASIARVVGVSQPSALEMIRRLRQLELVHRDRVALTSEGTSAALVLASRRQAAHLLSLDLGLNEDQAIAEAERLAPGMSPQITRKVHATHPRRL